MEQRISKYINRIYRCSILDRQDSVEAYGLSGYQLSYLLAIDREEGLTQDRMVNHMYLNKSSVARQLAQLERDGFIHRTQDPEDRRKLILSLTEEGQALIPLIRESIEGWNTEMLEDLTPDEQAEFIRLLRIVTRKATLRVERKNLSGARSSDHDDLKREPTK